jgi:hypothetical protein
MSIMRSRMTTAGTYPTPSASSEPHDRRAGFDLAWL